MMKYVLIVIMLIAALVMNFRANWLSHKIKGNESIVLPLKIAAAIVCIIAFAITMIWF